MPTLGELSGGTLKVRTVGAEEVLSHGGNSNVCVGNTSRNNWQQPKETQNEVTHDGTVSPQREALSTWRMCEKLAPISTAKPPAAEYSHPFQEKGLVPVFFVLRRF